MTAQMVLEQESCIRCFAYRLHPGTLCRVPLRSGIAGANRHVWDGALRQTGVR